MLRPWWIRTLEGPVNNLADYLRIVRPLLKPHEDIADLHGSIPALEQ